MMTDGTGPYSKTLLREAEDGTTTRYIIVKKSGNGFLVNIHELRPTKASEGYESNHLRSLVKMEWFSTAERSIEMAEIEFESGLDSGFREIDADRPGSR
jgi:hypothetical protein